MSSNSRFGIIIEAHNRARAALSEVDRQLKDLDRTMGGAATRGNALAQSGGSISRAMAAVQRDVLASTGSLGTFGRVLGGIGGPVGLGLTAIAALGASMVGLAKHAANVQEELQNVSERTGLTAQTIGALQIAATEAGSSFQNISPGLDLFNRKVGEAVQGNKDAEKAFKDLGVSIRDDLTGALKSSDTLLEETAKALGEISAPSERARLAMELFGRSGSRFITILSADMEENRKRAEELGLVYTGTLAEAAKKSDQSFDRLGTSVKGLTNSLGVMAAISLNPLIDQISKLAESMAKAAKQEADWAAQRKTQPFGQMWVGFGRKPDGTPTGGYPVYPNVGAPTTVPYGPMQMGPAAAGGRQPGYPNVDWEEVLGLARFRGTQPKLNLLPEGRFAGQPMEELAPSVDAALSSFEEFITQFENWNELLVSTADSQGNVNESAAAFKAVMDETEPAWVRAANSAAAFKVGLSNVAGSVGSALGQLAITGGNAVEAINQVARAIVSMIASIAAAQIAGPAGPFVAGVISSFGTLFQSGSAPSRSPMMSGAPSRSSMSAAPAGGSVVNVNFNVSPSSDRSATRRWVRDDVMPAIAAELATGRY